MSNDSFKRNQCWVLVWDGMWTTYQPPLPLLLLTEKSSYTQSQEVNRQKNLHLNYRFYLILPLLSENEFIVWSPEGFRRCDFEEDLCEWDLSSLSKLKWVKTNQENISIANPLKGPGRDHSNNSATGLKLSFCFSPWKPYCCSVSLPVCSVWL